MRAPTILAVLAAAVLAPWAILAASPASPSSAILVFENLTVADAPAVLSSSDRLVWDRLTGRAVAEAPASAMSRLERVSHSLVQGLPGKDFATALQVELPGFVAGVRGESRYAIKEPVRLIKPPGAPRQRPAAREQGAQSACLSEGFEVTPIWYEDGGPWWHYEDGQPYNNVGSYFWLDDNCDSFSGSWEAGSIMGGTLGLTLPCDATYDYNTDSWMEYAPWITCVSGVPDATLSFFTRLQTEDGYDFFYYLASVDGTNYSGYSLSGNYADTWYSVTQDMHSWYGLGDLASYPQFALAFAFQSDNQINLGFGVRVDDITLGGNTCPVIALAPSGLPGGVSGTAYSQTITASGGTAPYTYAKTGGALPAGLSLASGGLLSGIPSAAGTFNFTVTATDAYACTGSQAFSLTIGSTTCPTITLSPASLPSGTVGTAYSQAIAASGGTAPYTYVKTSGTLPAGLSLATGGLLSGIPSAAGTFNFTVTATDAHACTGSQSIAVTISTASCPTITLSPATLPSGTVGTGYYLALNASGGTAPYTYDKTSGTRPPGLTLASNGLLSGVPTAAGTFDFTVTATDARGCTGSQNYTTTIAAIPPPVILTMVKMGGPFRIVVSGSNLQASIKVFINANRWTNVEWKSRTKVVITGGVNLKAAVPQGRPTNFTFVNPDGGEATVTGWSW